MGTSRIEQSIEDIYDFIESCRTQPLSPSKVVVQKEKLYDLLDALRMTAPDEVKRYKKVIANREAILNDAQRKAEAMVEEARQRSESIINDSEIVQQAYQQANQIIAQATEEASRLLTQAHQESDQIRMSALAYTNDLLADAEGALGGAYENAKEKYEGLLSVLKFGLETIESNRAELGIDPPEPAPGSPRIQTLGQEYAGDLGAYEEPGSEEEFHVDEEDLLKGVED